MEVTFYEYARVAWPTLCVLYLMWFGIITMKERGRRDVRSR